jgi:hypothetical protein
MLRSKINSITKPVLITIGSFSLVLGVLGIFLPLLPATPFFLLSSACYVRSSNRLHGWLMANKYWGDYLRNIQGRKGIPLKGKVVAIFMLWVSLAFSMYRLNNLMLDLLLLSVGIGVTTLLLCMKTLKQA